MEPGICSGTGVRTRLEAPRKRLSAFSSLNDLCPDFLRPGAFERVKYVAVIFNRARKDILNFKERLQ